MPESIVSQQTYHGHAVLNTASSGSQLLGRSHKAQDCEQAQRQAQQEQRQDGAVRLLLAGLDDAVGARPVHGSLQHAAQPFRQLHAVTGTLRVQP